ncbi:MAG TPA: hypothetical protein VFC39_08545 [Acidobacteriaceae bacterium]|nr:hypothetical protein [Acidobacteriaceae bacterium]
MRTLFAISILALLALLWASISMARHVRRARRRRRHAPVPPPPIPDPEFSTQDLVASNTDQTTQ